MANQQTLDQARYIFSVGRMIRHHIFRTIPSLKICGQEKSCPDISMAQLNLMLALRINGDMTLSGLAAVLKVSPPSVSVMVERMVEKKMLIRERSATDRRKVTIALSKKSVQMMDEIEAKLLSAVVELVEEVGPETAEKWAEVLQRVEEVLQRRRQRGNHS